MKPIIYCTETQRGVDTFYLETSSGRYFLFQQTYRPGVHAHFSRGLRLEEACDFSKSRTQTLKPDGLSVDLGSAPS